MEIYDMKEVVLTTKNRNYLAGDYDPAERNVRSNRINHDNRIKENAYTAIYDLAHVYRHGENKHFTNFAEGWEPQDDDPINPWKVGPSIRYNRIFGAEGSAWEGEELAPAEENPDTTSTVELWKEDVANFDYDMSTPETQEALIDAVAFICQAADTGGLKISEVLDKGANRYLKNRPDPFAAKEKPESLFEKAEWEQLTRDRTHRLEIDVTLDRVRKDSAEQ